MTEKAMIAMSGGVDSSVAAYLTQRNGYECAGVIMRLVDNSWLPQDLQSNCTSRDDVEDARSIASRLGMPLHVLNATHAFQSHVVEPFIHCYECGDTPNPCIFCNRYLKFRYLLDKARTLGFEKLVTGHYARIRFDSQSNRYLLYKAYDSSKDQSYFLACLRQDQLAHVLFPLGELTKEQVRTIAEEQGFINARKRDSQDICFIPDGDYKSFMERFTRKTYSPGNYLDLAGNVVGQHCGAVGYTRGQRKGLGIALGAPVYVCSKDMKANTVTVGPDEALYSTTLLADDWNWFPFPTLTEPLRVYAKIRYRHNAQPATVFPVDGNRAKVVFDEPQRAITSGQSVVLYDGDLVIGSGQISALL